MDNKLITNHVAGKFYWVKTLSGHWEPAERVDNEYGGGWRMTGVDADYYDNEIAEAGAELIPPESRA